MVTMVGPPAGLLTARTPSNVPSRRSTPLRPDPAPITRAALAVVRDGDRAACAVRVSAMSTQIRSAPECLTALVRTSLTAKYAADSTGASARPGSSTSTSVATGSRSASARTASPRPRSASTGGWMPRTRSRSSVSASAEDCAGLREQLLGLRRVLLDQRLDGAEVHAHGDQPGLRAVVQIPLDTAQFGGRGVHGVVPGLGEPVDALLQLASRPGASTAPGDHGSGRAPGAGLSEQRDD